MRRVNASEEKKSSPSLTAVSRAAIVKVLKNRLAAPVLASQATDFD
jgi:hypothetical protein